jgi:hypothetical protein
MSEKWLSILSDGADLMMVSVPQFYVQSDNYSSARKNIDTLSSRVNEQLSLGVLEADVSATRMVHPLGLVQKTTEVGHVGPTKLRLIADAVSGSNDSIRNRPLSLTLY